jgi:uncharacterized protein YcfL
MKAVSLALLTLIACSANAFAQREVAATDFVQPGAKDIVIGGNELARDVTCAEGNSVYVEGQHNEVQIHGTCGSVRVQGNRNYVWVDKFTTVGIEGNDNTLFVSDVKTMYSSRGTNNRAEKAKH